MGGYIGSRAVNLSTTAADVSGNATIGGNLTVSGTTVTIDSANAQTVDLGDNDKIRLGDGDDLQIYHDGSGGNSYIDETGSGSLFIRDNNNIALKKQSDNTNMIVARAGAEVELYHNGSEKLATTSTGVNVDGSITIDANGSVGVNASNALQFTSSSHAVLNLGGSEILRATDGGNVGIATNSPTSLGTGITTLDLKGNSSSQTDRSGGIRFTRHDGTHGMSIYNADGASYIESQSTYPLLISTNGTERLRIDTETATLKTLGFKIDMGSVGGNPRITFDHDNFSTLNFLEVDRGSNAMEFFVNGSERMRIDSSGNVAIGTTTPNSYSGWTVLTLNGPTNGGIIDIERNGTLVGEVFADDASTFSLMAVGSKSLNLKTNNQERMRIDSSGNIFAGGKTGLSDSVAGHAFAGGSNAGLVYHTRDNSLVMSLHRMSSYGDVLRFVGQGSTLGTISVSSSGTTYNTTSDQRLKTDIQPIADGTEKLMTMNPVTHKWKTDPEADAVHGFIAQEMQDIAPEAVTGDPDGEAMMSMDYGRITPILVAALQDAHKKIEALETRLASMEIK